MSFDDVFKGEIGSVIIDGKRIGIPSGSDIRVIDGGLYVDGKKVEDEMEVTDVWKHGKRRK